MKKKTTPRKRQVSERAAVKQAEPSGAAKNGAHKSKDEEEDGPQDLETMLKGTGHQQEGEKRVSKWASVQCPYCGENFDVHFDSVVDGHSVQEDCAVCCKPIMLAVSVEEEDVHVSSYRA